MKYISTLLFLSISLSVFSQHSIMGTWTGVAYNPDDIAKWSQEWIFSKNSLTINVYRFDEKRERGTFEYQISDDNITFEFEGELVSFKILESTATALRLQSLSNNIYYYFEKKDSELRTANIPLYQTYKIINTDIDKLKQSTFIFSKQQEQLQLNIYNHEKSQFRIAEAAHDIQDVHFLYFQIHWSTRVNSYSTSPLIIIKNSKDTLYGIYESSTLVKLVPVNNQPLISSDKLVNHHLIESDNRDKTAILIPKRTTKRQISVANNDLVKFAFHPDEKGIVKSPYLVSNNNDEKIGFKEFDFHLSNDGQFLFIYYFNTFIEVVENINPENGEVNREAREIKTNNKFIFKIEQINDNDYKFNLIFGNFEDSLRN